MLSGSFVTRLQQTQQLKIDRTNTETNNITINKITMSDKEIIESIIRIIKQDGELFTDADCIDHIWALLVEKSKHHTI